MYFIPPIPSLKPYQGLPLTGKAEVSDNLTFKYGVENYNYFSHLKANLHDKAHHFPLLVLPCVK